MELVAAVQALRSVGGRARIELHSDSEYLIYGMRAFVFRWQRQGWRNRRGTQLQHRELWTELIDTQPFLSDGSGLKVTAGIATRAVPTNWRMKPPALSVCNRK
jgi:hypothetical protein